MKKILGICSNAVLYIFALAFRMATLLLEEARLLKSPYPLAAFVMSNARAVSLGINFPQVVLYTNGEVMFAGYEAGDSMYYHAKLDKSSLTMFLQRFSLRYAHKKCAEFYNASPLITDQRLSMFYTRHNRRSTIAFVYGMVDGNPVPSKRDEDAEDGSVSIPDELYKMRDCLYELRLLAKKIYVPKYAEILFWDRQKSSENVTQWPQYWPPLISTQTATKRGIYSITVDGALFYDIQSLTAKAEVKEVVELNGRCYGFLCKPIFHNESVWQSAFLLARANYGLNSLLKCR